MPIRALVAFGIVLGSGLLFVPGPGYCTGPQEAASADDRIVTEEKSIFSLTLEQALNRSLQGNTELKSHSHEVQAVEYEIDQAGRYINPELSLEVENFAGSGDFSGTGSAEISVVLSQKIELGGKRHQRISLSEQDKGIAEQAFIAARVELLSRTKRLFVAVLASQKRLALADDQAKLADRVLNTVKDRIDSGKAPELERLRFESLLLETKLREQQARQELVAARNALAVTWGQDEADFEWAQGDIEQLPGFPNRLELMALVDRSPGMAVQQAVSTRAGQYVSLAEISGIPDLTVSLGGKSFEETDDYAFVAGFSIDLPLFDRNQGGVGAAKARYARKQADLRAKRLQLQTEVGNIWKTLQSTYAEATLLKEQLLPTLQRSFEAISYGYQAGKYGYLDVLDAEQTLFATRNRYVDSLQEYHQALTELERLLGQTFTKNGTEALASNDQ